MALSRSMAPVALLVLYAIVATSNREQGPQEPQEGGRGRTAEGHPGRPGNPDAPGEMKLPALTHTVRPDWFSVLDYVRLTPTPGHPTPLAPHPSGSLLALPGSGWRRRRR